MYNPENRQYIFKQSGGKVLSLYYDERAGLCQSTLTRRNTWMEPILLQKNLNPSFFADIDFEDCIHLIFQDSHGNIFYTRMDASGTKTSPVLNSKTPSAYNKHLRLIPSKSAVHLFYVLKHNNNSILAHQLIVDGKAGSPRVIDYVIDNECPYAIVSDRSENIYAFYQSSDGQYLQIGYKKYIPAQKAWSEFTPITRHKGDCEYPHAIVDIRNVVHICYQRHSQKQYELVYQQKVPDKNIWTEEQIIHSSSALFANSSVLIANEIIYIYWIRDDSIYHATSPDYGVKWSRPARYSFQAGKQLMCISYKSNSTYEADKIFAQELPGSFMNGFKLAFYQSTAESESNLSLDEFKNVAMENMKLLKASMEELKGSGTSLGDEVQSIRSAQQNQERELVKYSVKLNLLENEINQLKKHLNTLQSLQIEIEDLKKKLLNNGETAPKDN